MKALPALLDEATWARMALSFKNSAARFRPRDCRNGSRVQFVDALGYLPGPSGLRILINFIVKAF